MASQAAEIDPDGIGEEKEHERGLGQRSDRPFLHTDVDDVEATAADDETEADEDHRAGDRGGFEAPRHEGIGKHEAGDDGDAGEAHCC